MRIRRPRVLTPHDERLNLVNAGQIDKCLTTVLASRDHLSIQTTREIQVRNRLDSVNKPAQLPCILPSESLVGAICPNSGEQIGCKPSKTSSEFEQMLATKRRVTGLRCPGKGIFKHPHAEVARKDGASRRRSLDDEGPNGYLGCQSVTSVSAINVEDLRIACIEEAKSIASVRRQKRCLGKRLFAVHGIGPRQQLYQVSVCRTDDLSEIQSKILSGLAFRFVEVA